jgi:phenylalanyl-tRNA synthetase beta chain
MRVPLSWLKEYVPIRISAEELAERLTLAGLEVKALEYYGVPQGVAPEGITVPPSDHLVWARDKIVLGLIREVKPHPNADRLVLAMVDHGVGELEQVVTGAPNLYPYKGQGPLAQPLYTALAREGAEVYDGHAEGRQRMILKEKALRGIPNRSMVCSAKELGLSEEHEGILLLEPVDAPPGTPFVDIMGDVIFEIDLTPNLARAYGILGVAREVAALTGETLREPSYDYVAEGGPLGDQFSVEIRDSLLNPRFTAMLIKDVQIGPSPEWMRRRLEAVGTRSINNIVDITNYVMFETGQPLHAFDYDVLVKRAGGKAPHIITRRPLPGEKLTTLDGVTRDLDDNTILVCDTAGVLSLGGIMGGAESEISDATVNVLLESANWNFINIRRTMFVQKMSSEAGLRFSRGIHPALARRALTRAAELMRTLGKGKIADGVVDLYPTPAPTIVIDLPLSEIRRIVGITLDAETVAGILTRLQFEVVPLSADVLRVTVPDHRVDITSDVIGVADLCEEVARIYGYDRIPDTLIEDMLPVQSNNDELQREERVRDLLAAAGLREVVNYRLTTPESEARLQPQAVLDPNLPYVRLANPISAERTVLRRTLLNGVLQNLADNRRTAPRQRLFEIGAVFLPVDGAKLPAEPRRLAIALMGIRTIAGWEDAKTDAPLMNFYDLKGVIESLTSGLRLPGGKDALTFQPESGTAYFPGRSAGLYLRGQKIGMAGEIHPLVRRHYDLPDPVLAAEIDLDALLADLPLISRITPIIAHPPVFQDIALVVADNTPASAVEAVIRKAGGDLLMAVNLFDVYRGDPIPAGKKSLAYALTYQASDRTLTDKEVASVHSQIVRACERELGAMLRA